MNDAVAELCVHLIEAESIAETLEDDESMKL
jgi:hypothetical protein